MGRLNSRVARLEEHSAKAEEAGLSTPQKHYRRAFSQATQAEREALEQLLAGGDEQELLRLWEEVLRRQAPTLANDVRARRDLLHRELYRLEKEWEQQGHVSGIGKRGRALSAVITARVNRSTVISRGAEPIEDEEEAHSLVKQITAAASLDEVWVLIGLLGGEK